MEKKSKNIFKVIAIFIILCLILFFINLFRNLNIINKIYETKESFVNSENYKIIISQKDSIGQTQIINYNTQNAQRIDNNTDNLSATILTDKLSNIVKSINHTTKEYFEFTDDATNTISQGSYKYLLFLQDNLITKDEIISQYLLKPIKRENGNYILEVKVMNSHNSNAEYYNTYYINSESNLINKILSGKTFENNSLKSDYTLVQEITSEFNTVIDSDFTLDLTNYTKNSEN